MSYQLLPEIQSGLEAAKQLIDEAQRVLITMHCRPDGDAAGSAIAMWHILRALGKEAYLFNVDEIPLKFQFLEGADQCMRRIEDGDHFDLLIVLDSAEPRLLGRGFPQNFTRDKVLYVDHHSVAFDEVDGLLHSSKASAAGELVFHLLHKLGVPLTKPIAEALFTAILTDTGSFRYTSTTADCLAISSVLVDAGLDVWHISSNVYERNPVEKLKLLGLVLPTLWLSDDGRIASLHATRDMLRECKCSGAMTDGFINYARSVDGVEVSIFLTQLEENCYRLSFRSSGNLDVSKIAAGFGGGGHKNAAACTVKGTVEEIRAKVVSIVEKLI